MQFKVRRGGERLTVSLDGRLDENAASQLYDNLLAMDTRPYREVALDIARVSFIGSAGIAKLMSLHNHFVGQKAALLLLNPPVHIFDLFESMRLDKLFAIKRP